MAQIIIEVPDVILADVRDTLALKWGYSSTIVDGSGNQIPNTQSKAAFVKSEIAKFVKTSYQSAKAEAQAIAAQETTLNQLKDIAIQ